MDHGAGETTPRGARGPPLGGKTMTEVGASQLLAVFVQYWWDWLVRRHSRGSTLPAHVLTHPAPLPVRPTLQLTVGTTGEACSAWKRPRPRSPGSASTDTNADPVTSRYNKRPKRLITNYFGKRPEPAAASPPATTAAAAAAVAAVRSPPPEWSERGPLLGPDDSLLATLELLRHQCDQHYPGVFEISKDQIKCTICDFEADVRSNAKSLATHYDQSRRRADARKRRRIGLESFLSREPDHQAKASRYEAMLMDRRRECRGYHWPQVTTHRSAYNEGITIPLSVLWENGRPDGTALGEKWHAVPGQTFLYSTGRMFDGKPELIEHRGTIRNTNKCLGTATNADGSADGTNCCSACRRVAKSGDMARLLLRRRTPPKPIGANNRYSSTTQLAKKAAALKTDNARLRQAKAGLELKVTKLRTRAEELGHAAEKGSAGHAANCIRKIREHAAGTGDLSEANAILDRVADVLEHHARRLADKDEGTHLANGHRTTEATRKLAEAVLTRFGGSAVSFATDNGGLGASVSTARKRLAKDEAPFVVGKPAPRENFRAAFEVYERLRQELVSTGDMDAADVVVFELAEDETPVPAEPCIVRVPARQSRIDAGECTAGDTELVVAGICGRRGSEHKCTLGYSRYLHPDPLGTIVDVCVNEVAGGYLSAVMLNPLDDRFPARAVILDSCCNRFDAVPETQGRWAAARAQFKATMGDNYVLAGQ